ncbi:selenocysteinyl-tRNA(Sec) synthase, partial [Campylobacter jejuni]|nr:selenocysteinyl-tRNA(Sec) synthase [Campylobacter jejuni]
GDKLFGSVQVGIILGKKELIEKLKQNQLLRMLRVDKLTLSFLNESLKAYLQKDYEKIITLKLLNDDLSFIEEKALRVQKELKFQTQLKKSKSLVG